MNLTKLGRYEIKAFLGRGGMATVYRAFDPSFGREVAIKVLPRELVDDPDFRARFEREARIIAGLEHPAIVPVYDFGHENDQPYIVMRLMLGGSLADQLSHGPIPLGKTVDILSRLALALDRAHERGIIHRDLKPANFLLDKEDEPYISDFGIAKLTAEGSTSSKTAIIGTAAYMSPEQWHGEDLDGRCDVYALVRITVYDIFSYLAAGMTEKQILEDFPYLTAEDIQACYAFAADREAQATVAHSEASV